MPDLQLSIAQGQLIGCRCITEQGFIYNSYSGIPYAKPPIGKLRFRDPLPADGWKGVRDATKEGQVCAQYDMIFTRQYIGDEDCLFLNVHTPEFAKEGTNLPVMVWIHGGGFVLGSGNKIFFGPDHLVENNVVFVTINYRLGAQGFLCMYTPDIPGNAGLKDQIMALRWVQSNISKFGGDPNNVTITGESAGAASVQYMLLSEMGNGLFHRAIMQSGSCLSDWGRQSQPKQSAVELAKKMGFQSNDREAVLQFLLNVPIKDLVTAVFTDFNISDVYNFAPVVEKQHPGVEALISTPPLELMTSGKYNKVPVIKGFNSHEGILFTSKLLFGQIDVTESTTMDDFVLGDVPLLAKKLEHYRPEAKSAILEKIRRFYFPKNKRVCDGYIDLMSDIAFTLEIDRSVKIMSRHGQNVYYYLFTYGGSLIKYKPMGLHPYDGAAHADELPYLFVISLEEKGDAAEATVINDNDIATIRRMTKMWTNFAKEGNPTPNVTDVITTIWKPVLENEVNCLEINKDLRLIKNPISDRVKFWTDLYIYK